MSACLLPFFFFFNDTATTEIYTLSLHDALPISGARLPDFGPDSDLRVARLGAQGLELEHLVAEVHERAGIGAHEERREFPNKLLPLLGAGAPPVGAHRDPGRVREIEMGEDFRLDEARDLLRVAGLDVFILA